MLQRLLPLATGRNVLILLAGILLVNLVVIPWAMVSFEAMAGPDVAPPDIRFWMSSEAMYDLWSRYGPEGRSFYVWLAFTMDLAYPLIYGFFFALLLLWISKKGNFQGGFWLQTAWLPLLAMAFDLVENMVNATMALAFPSYSQVFPLLSNVLGATKFLFLGLSAGLVLVFFAKWGDRALQQRKTNETT